MTARRFFIAGLLFLAIAAAASLALRVSFGPRPVFVRVRWAPDVDGPVRQWLERRYNLAQGEQLEGRTWGYTLVDPSSANVRAIVIDPSVEDTQEIDRRAFRVDEAPRRPYVTPYGWIPVRLRGVSLICLLIGLVGLGLGVVEHAAAGTTGHWSVSRPRSDVIFFLVLLAALLIRLFFATTAEYLYDEDSASIPRSQTISFTPGNLQLPIRGQNHPAMPAYFVKLSGTLFGTTPLGYRMVHVLAGMGTIVMIFVLARTWYGPVAARWAASLLAFNEYYLGVSSRATAHVPYLFFLAAAVYGFGRFVEAQRAIHLYAAGAALGLAFYCKEHAALLLPVFLLMLLQPAYRHWFRRPHVYLACALFFLVIAPDLLWNLRASQDLGQATYADHLQRIGGLGFSPYPLMFFGRDATEWVYRAVTGRALLDPTAEYWSMNPAIGVLLLGSVLVTAVGGGAAGGGRPRTVASSHRHTFLLLLFWCVFGFFTSIRPGDPSKNLDPASWIWVDATLFPAVILAGAWLAAAEGRRRAVTWAFACGAMVYAGAQVVG